MIYKLVKRKPVLVQAAPSSPEWNDALMVLETGKTRVAEHFIDDVVKNEAGTKREEIHISTVFLVIDHGFGYSKKPVVFETMVFGGKLNGEQRRSCSWSEAMKEHREMVKLARSSCESKHAKVRAGAKTSFEP